MQRRFKPSRQAILTIQRSLPQRAGELIRRDPSGTSEAINDEKRLFFDLF